MSSDWKNHRVSFLTMTAKPRKIVATFLRDSKKLFSDRYQTLCLTGKSRRRRSYSAIQRWITRSRGITFSRHFANTQDIRFWRKRLDLGREGDRNNDSSSTGKISWKKIFQGLQETSVLRHFPTNAYDKNYMAGGRTALWRVTTKFYRWRSSRK